MPGIETYIDDALFVSHQEVPEESGFIEVAKHYHVIHTLYRGGVHRPDGVLLLLVDLVPLCVRHERGLLNKRLTQIFQGLLKDNFVGWFVPFLHRQLTQAAQCLSP